jgi:molybdenum cofactor cytidylyltransferase
LPSREAGLAVNGCPFAVIILGAGRSARMGRPKLLLPWGHTTILGHLIEQWSRLGAAQIAVVRAADDEALEHERLRHARPTDCIINPAPERGMFSSIQCASLWPRWKNSLTHWILALGDQPHLRNETLQELVAAAQTAPEAIHQPARAGRARHPVLLPRSAFQRLGSATVSDLKQFLESCAESRRRIEMPDAGLELDLDTPQDYDRAKAVAGLT